MIKKLHNDTVFGTGSQAGDTNYGFGSSESKTCWTFTLSRWVFKLSRMIFEKPEPYLTRKGVNYRINGIWWETKQTACSLSEKYRRYPCCLNIQK